MALWEAPYENDPKAKETLCTDLPDLVCTDSPCPTDRGGDHMRDDMTPVVIDLPTDQRTVEVYVVSDIHCGNYLFNQSKWERLKAEVLAAPNRYIIFAGDAMENAVPGSKSDVFSQNMHPQAQQEWITEQFKELKDRILCVIDGNHERNRSTKLCGLYPLYDACCIAGIQDRYRPHFCLLDLGVGMHHPATAKRSAQQFRYVGYIVHKAKDMKNFSTADMVDGIDFMVYGHDHDAKDHARARLTYDTKAKQLRIKCVETVNSGAFLDYGGYAADGAYRPGSTKMYKMILSGDYTGGVINKPIQTVGFYL